MPTPTDFNFCVQYYRQPTPPSAEWEDDLAHIARLGFTAIQLRPQWVWHEREEGKFLWDDLDRLIELAGHNGLNVLFKFFLETAPAWLYKNYDARRVTPDGSPIVPRARGSFPVGGWMPCFDRPVVWEKAARFVRAGVERYRHKPNILGWHLWNEPRSRPFQDCACEHSTAFYRKWLAETFGSVEHFNETFGLAVQDWGDIDPPPDISGYYDSWLWRTSRAHAVAAWIGRMAALVRALDPDRPLFCHVGFNTLLQPTFTDTSHDVLTSREVDVFGTSLPHWTGDFHTFFNVERPALFSNPLYRDESYLYGLQARWIGAVKDYFWINEVYGNSWNYMAEDYTGDDLRFMLASTISEGARGIVVWQFKAERFSEESVTSGLVEIDGSDTDRSLAVSSLCKARQRAPAAFASWRPEKARVAVVFDFAADMYSQMEHAESMGNLGTVRYRYKESVKGWYGMLWRQGLAVDLVAVEYLERIRDYELVVLPYMHLVGEEQAGVLRAYVEDGGTLVADPGLAFRDRRAWVQPVRPGQGLDLLFGCREPKLKAIPEPVQVMALDVVMEAHAMLARLEPCGTGFDLSGGANTLIANSVGKGRTFYFSFYPGLSHRAAAGDRGFALAARLLAEAGIETHWSAERPLLRLRKGTVGNAEENLPAAWVLNFEPDELPLPLRNLEPGSYRCALTGRSVNTAADGAVIAGREVMFLVPEKFDGKG